MLNIILLQKYYKHVLYLYKNIKETFIKKINNIKKAKTNKKKYLKKIFFKLSNARIKKLQIKLSKSIGSAISHTVVRYRIFRMRGNWTYRRLWGVFRKLPQPSVSSPEIMRKLPTTFGKSGELAKDSNIKNKSENKTKNKIKYDGYNIKFCVFAGRQKNLEILHSYIELALEKLIINEYHIFDFSKNINDHNFLKSEYERLSKLYNIKNNKNDAIYLHNYIENEIILKTVTLHQQNWNPFYKEFSENSNDKDIIIKCDDDILFIDVHNLENIINDRINDRTSFLIHSNCINNGVCAYYQKDIFKNLTENLSIYPKGGILGVLFEKPEIAYSIHNDFINDMITSKFTKINKYIIDDVYINNRISINFILIHGSDAKYLKNISTDDEYELSSLIPEKLLRPNKIKGDFITAHLSYNMQEKIMLNKDKILNSYKKILEIYLATTKIEINKKHMNIPKPILNYDGNSKIFIVKNWIKENHYYIKNIDTNKYLYCDFIQDELILSDKKTLFEINNIKNNGSLSQAPTTFGKSARNHAQAPDFWRNIQPCSHLILLDSLQQNVEILLGIYNLTKFNCKGNFRNKNLVIQCLKDKNEKIIIFDELDENNICCIKFLKYNNYLSINSYNKNLEISKLKETKWKIEKAICKNEYIKVKRFLKDNKYYYQNIANDEIYTNYYLGWGYENILDIK